jgi:Putative DNA-binding domain
MVALRSRRLERLFGARLDDDLGYAQVADLVTNTVAEAYDLDFKATLYGKSDKERRDLAGDVAALANTAGGVIVLGIAEDDQARAASVTSVLLSDAEVGRIRQIVASQVSPLPTFDVLRAEDPQQPGRGFMLIAVPRSPMGPHAVLVNEALRFPRRNGTTTTYLSEPEVADAYRTRLAGIQNRFDDLAQYERNLIARLDTSEQTYVVVTLVPDLGGHFTIDMKAMRDFQQEIVGHQPLILNGALLWTRAFVGSRRLVADGTSNDDAGARWLACELHESGAGSFAAAVDRRRDDATASELHEEAVVNVVWSGLRFLARHARDRAAAGGSAVARATVWPVSEQLPARLMHSRFHGIREVLGRHTPTSPPVSVGVFNIDDLAEDGPPLVSATYTLATGLFQEFGYPEALQMTSGGAIRINYWRHGRPELMTWASGAGVEVSEEVIG